jgi:predicted dehydrogenase
MQATIIGAGGSGLLHALALRAAGVRIAAVFDPNRERRAALADMCGARAVDSFAAAASVDADIAAVCSPPRLHVGQAEALATGGRIVFVEKPVATTRGELDRLRALPACVPIVQWRAGRALRALRRAIQHGELGEAPVIACDLAWARSDDYFQARRGWGCGAVLSIGVHAIDAIVWALGRTIDSVAALTSNARSVAEAETAAVVVFRFESGAMATIRLSLDGGADATRITICGAGKTAQLLGGEGDPTAGTLVWSTRDERDRARLEALERDTPGALGSPLLVPYLGAAIAAIREGEAPGESQRLLSIVDVAGAHAVAMACAAKSTGLGSAGRRRNGASLPMSDLGLSGGEARDRHAER